MKDKEPDNPLERKVIDLSSVRDERASEKIAVSLPTHWRRDAADLLQARATQEDRAPISIIYSALSTYDYIARYMEDGAKVLVENSKGELIELVWGYDEKLVTPSSITELNRRSKLARRLGQLIKKTK